MSRPVPRGIVARIHLAALAANARTLRDAGQPPVADLRHDAWGHGLSLIGPVLREAGIDHAVLDTTGRAEARALGIRESGGPMLPAEALYGLDGSSSPVMSLHGDVLTTKRLRAGEGVSYGYTHRATADTRIALARGGYAQGVVRALGNRIAVTARGRRHPIVGRIAMDVCVVDIGDTGIARGDEVTFFGDDRAGQPSLHEWARATGFTPAELVTAIGLRVRREAVR